MKIPFFNFNKDKEKTKSEWNWPEPPPPVVTKKIKRVGLKITFKNNTTLTFSRPFNINENISHIRYFYGFFDWFFRRKTDYYLIVHKEGSTIVIRSEIHLVEFTQKVIEEEVK